jgi:hypothetical protein
MGIGCVLRLSGESFDLDLFLKETGVMPTAMWHKGDKRSRSQPPAQQDGCTLSVSNADELDSQCHDALRFLESNKKWLDTMRRNLNVVDPMLDFSASMPEDNIAARFYQFPIELIRSLAECGISISLSTYRVSSPSESAII